MNFNNLTALLIYNITIFKITVALLYTLKQKRIKLYLKVKETIPFNSQKMHKRFALTLLKLSPPQFSNNLLLNISLNNFTKLILQKYMYPILHLPFPKLSSRHTIKRENCMSRRERWCKVEAKLNKNFNLLTTHPINEVQISLGSQNEKKK